jgi:hypothetical protein
MHIEADDRPGCGGPNAGPFKGILGVNDLRFNLLAIAGEFGGPPLQRKQSRLLGESLLD